MATVHSCTQMIRGTGSVTDSVNQQTAANIPVIDYEGSQYRVDFWMGQGRAYEDAVERRALQRLLPTHGGRIAELGAGFGRLAALYQGYDQIILFDFSRTLLQDAARDWGDDPRFVFVAGNLYNLPLATGILDTLVMVRVMHHLADVPAALRQMHRTMHRFSVGVIEYANKRNAKAVLRWGLRRQSWSPWTHEPVEFVKLNFDFHPDWMDARLREAGLQVCRRYAVSHFRLGALKRHLSPDRLAQMDGWLFAPGGTFPLAPSVIVKTTAPSAAPRAAAPTDPVAVGQLLRCPRCGTEGLLPRAPDRLECPGCRTVYARRDKVWDFKEPLP